MQRLGTIAKRKAGEIVIEIPNLKAVLFMNKTKYPAGVPLDFTGIEIFEPKLAQRLTIQLCSTQLSCEYPWILNNVSPMVAQQIGFITKMMYQKSPLWMKREGETELMLSHEADFLVNRRLLGVLPQLKEEKFVTDIDLVGSGFTISQKPTDNDVRRLVQYLATCAKVGLVIRRYIKSARGISERGVFYRIPQLQDEAVCLKAS